MVKNEFKTHSDKGRKVNIRVKVELNDQDVIQRNLEKMITDYNVYHVFYSSFGELMEDVKDMIRDHLKVYVEAVDTKEKL